MVFFLVSKLYVFLLLRTIKNSVFLLVHVNLSILKSTNSMCHFSFQLLCVNINGIAAQIHCEYFKKNARHVIFTIFAHAFYLSNLKIESYMQICWSISVDTVHKDNGKRKNLQFYFTKLASCTNMHSHNFIWLPFAQQSLTKYYNFKR